MVSIGVFFYRIPSVDAVIRRIVVLFYGTNRLLWRGVMDDNLTAKVTYDSLRVAHSDIVRCRNI